MYKIAVIGDRQSISGFASLGLETFESEDAQKTQGLIKKLSSNDFAIIFITEKEASKVRQTIEKYKDKPYPAIILIPGLDNNTGEGMAAIHKSVEKAVGKDILSN